jgi:hypothetical protein
MPKDLFRILNLISRQLELVIKFKGLTQFQKSMQFERAELHKNSNYSTI